MGRISNFQRNHILFYLESRLWQVAFPTAVSAGHRPFFPSGSPFHGGEGMSNFIHLRRSQGFNFYAIVTTSSPVRPRTAAASALFLALVNSLTSFNFRHVIFQRLQKMLVKLYLGGFQIICTTSTGPEVPKNMI